MAAALRHIIARSITTPGRTVFTKGAGALQCPTAAATAFLKDEFYVAFLNHAGLL